ncbi:MAG: M23 family metallopeptidase [Chloroflexi bacterium]|nr:M23 family metallopeptidase [Chloroflexota bacterium]
MSDNRDPYRILLLTSIGLAGLCLIAAAYVWDITTPRQRDAITGSGAWSTPRIARRFDFPLLPSEQYGPYVQGISGELTSDTRYGVQNPAWGNQRNCFLDSDGNDVPFSQLFHSGVDLWALNSNGQVILGTAGSPIHAVADGVVTHVQDAGQDGYIIITKHRLQDGTERFIYSAFWHVDYVQVGAGDPVNLGQVVAQVYDQGGNSHLHWEMHTFSDGTLLFPPDTAGGRGTCNGRVAGVGYTWDDNPLRAHPDYYGYVDPIAFVSARIE